ncbi:hypothetical protein Tco_0756922 [Tanacetum coccineum]
MTMDMYTKTKLWLYWKRGGDEEVLTEEELFDLEETYEDDEHEVAKIFRIETGIFHFEVPLYKAFNNFNYLLKIDIDLLTDIFLDSRRMKSLTTNETKGYHGFLKNHGFCNGGELSGMIRVGYMPYFQDYKWYDGLEDGKLKEEYLKQKSIYEGSWGNATQGWRMNDNECSPFTHWKNHVHGTYINVNVNANYNPYLDDCRIFNDCVEANNKETIQDKKEPKEKDEDIGKLDDYLVQKDAPYHANNKEKQYKKERCELLRNPHQEPPTCKIERFEVIKYSFGPAKKYVAIKEYKCDDLSKTKDGVASFAIWTKDGS